MNQGQTESLQFPTGAEFICSSIIGKAQTSRKNLSGTSGSLEVAKKRSTPCAQVYGAQTLNKNGLLASLRYVRGRGVRLLFRVRAMQRQRSVAACRQILIDGRGRARTNTVAQIILLDQKSLSAESLNQSGRGLPQIPTKPCRVVSSLRRDEANDSA